jgi:hypothetical protein
MQQSGLIAQIVSQHGVVKQNGDVCGTLQSSAGGPHVAISDDRFGGL